MTDEEALKNLCDSIVKMLDTRVIDGRVYMDSYTIVRVAATAVAALQSTVKDSDEIYELHRAAGVAHMATLLMGIHTALADKYAAEITNEASTQTGLLYPPKED